MPRHRKHHHQPKKWYRRANFKRGVIKLSLNLAILAGFGGLIRYGYLLFSQQINPLIGSIIFILSIVAWILLIIFLRRRYGRAKPGFKLTTFSAIAILLILTFAGIQPMASYKDALIDSYRTTQAERAVEEAARAVEEATKEEEQRTQEIENLECEVVNLVNAIRIERGIAPLIWDDELYSYSKRHSENMAIQGQLFHTSMDKPYAENCWGGEGSTSWGAEVIVESWMSSPPHRTWLLCPHLTHIAVGIKISDTGMYASWTFWIGETQDSDWWYGSGASPPSWWY